ncbi:MAG TPA: iron ABC transporter permease [Casimicrobiaceae bacterium]|nr:iron ABC transporter permease [Casimicrobiaceae bacterium]
MSVATTAGMPVERAPSPRRYDATMPLAILLALVLVTLVGLPMFWLVVTSLRDDASQWSLVRYAQVLSDPAFLGPLWTSLWTSAAVGALCVVAALPMSWLVARTDLPGKRVFRTLILASFVTPPFLGAFAWVLLGGPNAGLINQWYYALFGLKPFDSSALVNIFSAGGMVFVMALYTFPYVFTFVANSLDVIPADLEDAASILGASQWRTALDITLPLVMPALLAGFLIAFLQSLTLFGVPAILALPAGVDTMTTKIWSLFQFPPQLGLAAAAALPLLVMTAVLLRAQAMIMGRRGYSVIGGKSSAMRAVRLRQWTVPALMLFVFVLACSVVLPYAVLLRTAFVKNWAGPSTLANFSLEHWRFVFFDFSQTRLAFQNTFILCVAAATAGTLLVTIVGYLAARRVIWGHRAIGFLATSPVAIPGIVLAVGLFLAYTHPPLVLYGTLAIIFLAYVTKELPVGYQQITAALKSVHPELEDAGRIFGATRLRALADITAPLIRNGVIATWIFIFIGSVRELSATILLFTARTKTISVTMFDLRESNDWGPIAVLSVTMLVITFVLVAIVTRFTNRRLA